MQLIAQAAAQGGTKLPPFQAPVDRFAPDLSSAQGAVSPLATFISTIIGFVTILAGIMFLIYLIVAGLSWVMAGGEKGKVETAKSQMTNAALGLVVVAAAYSIVGIVGGVLGIDVLNPVKTILNLSNVR